MDPPTIIPKYKLKHINPIITNNLRDIYQICKTHNIEKLWAFGSVCTPYFNDKSDVDFLVDFKPLPLEDYADNYFIVCDIMESLLNRKVDLVTVNSLGNPYFIKSLEKNKTILYE